MCAGEILVNGYLVVAEPGTEPNIEAKQYSGISGHTNTRPWEKVSYCLLMKNPITALTPIIQWPPLGDAASFIAPRLERGNQRDQTSDRSPQEKLNRSVPLIENFVVADSKLREHDLSCTLCNIILT